MDIFTLLSICNPGEEKGKPRKTGVCVGIFVALVTVIPGAILKFSGDVHAAPGFWRWLWYGETVVDTDFSTAEGRVRVVDLDGEWLFATGDDANRRLPDFDDASWSHSKVSENWEAQGYGDYDGYAWYRRRFNVASGNLSQPLYAFLGRIDDVDEVFINGHAIGGLGVFPPDYSSAWDIERFYRVPSDLLRAGTNVITVRVYDGRNDGGIIGRGLGLYTTNLPRPLIDLAGKWEFATGNNPGWKAHPVGEEEFHSIQVPTNWDNVGYKYYDGHAWYRKTFGTLPVSENETLILFLGRIDDTDEVFLNGERIGGSDRYDIDRRYEFSSGLLQETNTLAVHVYDGQQGGGIYSGPVGIMRKKDFIEYQERAQELNKWDLGEAADKTIDWLLGRDGGT